MKSIDIFIKSYRQDFSLLKYSLMSIKKNVTGYENIRILIPKEDGMFLHELGPEIPDRTTIQTIDEYGSGYLYQQVCKMNAWKHSDADYILFSDSDIIFDRPVNVQDLIKDGKPEILYTPYDKVGSAICWKEPTEHFTGWPQEFEFMRRNNLCYHRSTLVLINEFYPYLEQEVMASERFSEFNFLGAWSFKHERNKYNFVNTEEGWIYIPPLGIQLWGWAQKDNQDEPHPYEYARSLKVINETLGLNITEI